MTQKLRRFIFNFWAFTILILTSISSIYSKNTEEKDLTSSHIPLDGQSIFPPTYDDWCRKYCSSQNECYNKFQLDYIDLQVTIKNPTLDEPGTHLFHGKFHGKSITRQTFDTQFIFDISSAVNITPCKVYIIDVLVLKDGIHTSKFSSSTWDNENILVSFQLFNISTTIIKELTKQAQNAESVLYSGKVCVQRILY